MAARNVAGDENYIMKSRMLYCTACDHDIREEIIERSKVYSHPVLKVLICKECLDFYGDGYFELDKDGSHKYCRWCGQGGRLFCCSSCPCTFCKECIKRNFGRSLLVDTELPIGTVLYRAAPPGAASAMCRCPVILWQD